MYIKNDMDFNDLMNNCWSGAIDTLKTIEEHGKEDELMDYLKEIFESHFDNVPTMTEVNDCLWLDWENIFDALGISESEDEDEIEYEEGVTERNTKDFNEFCSLFNKCENCPYNGIDREEEDCCDHYLDLKFPDDEDDEKDGNGGYIIPF